MGTKTETLLSGTTDTLGSNIGFFFLLFGGVIAFAFGISYFQHMK